MMKIFNRFFVMNIVRVALAVPLPRFFDYLYSPDLTPIVGGRVLIPFGSLKRVGIVVDLRFFGCRKRKDKTDY